MTAAASWAADAGWPWLNFPHFEKGEIPPWREITRLVEIFVKALYKPLASAVYKKVGSEQEVVRPAAGAGWKVRMIWNIAIWSMC